MHMHMQHAHAHAAAHVEREGPHEELHCERRGLVRLVERRLGRRLWGRLGVGLSDEYELVSRGALRGRGGVDVAGELGGAFMCEGWSGGEGTPGCAPVG